jgi:DNA primase
VYLGSDPRDLLAEIGLSSCLNVGSKGFHVVVPLDGEAGFEDVAAFAHAARARWSSETRST